MLEVEKQTRSNEKLSKYIEDWEYYTKSMKEYKASKQVRSEKMKELEERQNHLKLVLQKQEELEKASLLRKQNAEEEAKKARVAQKENTEKDATIVATGKAELTKMAEHKMRLAADIGDTSKISEQEQAKEREALLAKEEAMNEANRQVKLLEGQFRAQQDEAEVESEKLEEFKRSHNEQISSHKSLARKFSEMYETEKELYDAKYNELTDRLTEEFVRKLQDLKSTAKRTQFKKEVFEQGSRMLEDVKTFELKNAEPTPGRPPLKEEAKDMNQDGRLHRVSRSSKTSKGKGLDDSCKRIAQNDVSQKIEPQVFYGETDWNEQIAKSICLQENPKIWKREH
eukprot:jgi/Psemu1/58818/gm1.58818_g